MSSDHDHLDLPVHLGAGGDHAAVGECRSPSPPPLSHRFQLKLSHYQNRMSGLSISIGPRYLIPTHPLSNSSFLAQSWLEGRPPRQPEGRNQ